MNRLGITILLAILAVIAGFWLLQGHVPKAPSAPAPPAAPAAPARPAAPQAGSLAIPVAGVGAEQLTDSFGDAREGGGAHRHGAIDIMAPRGTPVLAAEAGTIEKLFDSKLGGHTIYLRSANGGIVTYYAHLDTYATGLREGQRVVAGQQIGTVGFSGDASAAGPHLHFEVKRMAPGEKWHQGTAVDPYPLLGGR